MEHLYCLCKGMLFNITFLVLLLLIEDELFFSYSFLNYLVGGRTQVLFIVEGYVKHVVSVV
jgi:hypothetical protein